MPATITKPHETEELQEQQRATAQISQAEHMTIAGHIHKKLRLGRRRLAKTWKDANQSDDGDAEADDDMQVLARDITFTQAAKQEPPQLPPPAPPKSRWPVAATIALGLGVPATTAIAMAPMIIDAITGRPSVEQPTEPTPEYVPILLPGKPTGVE